MRPRLVPVVLLASLLALTTASSAHATSPGANGKIAFESFRNSNNDIYTINPDGSGLTNLTASPSFGELRPSWAPDGGLVNFIRCTPCEQFTINSDGSGLASFPEPVNIGAEPVAWSPDGQRIAFVDNSLASDIYVMNVDGTGVRNLTQNPPCAYSDAPSWSPRGDKIAFHGGPITDCDTDEPNRGHSEVYTVNTDGSGLVQLTSSPISASDPDWSPDAQKIAYLDYAAISPSTYKGGIFVMSDSGANRTRLTDASDTRPVWSPDGTQIAFRRQEPTQGNFPNIYRMNADGTGQTPVTTDAPWDDAPTWQPLPGSSPPPPYAAPKFASTVKASLVPAFKQCRGGKKANASHSPPLATDSCTPPKLSSVAHFGPQATGLAQLAVIYGDTNPANGDQADVTILSSLSDVQTAAGADYEPNPVGADATLVTRFRFTDRANGTSGGDPETATDFDFSVPVDCAATAASTLGSSCGVDTTADTVTPGLIKENKATVLQTFRFRLNDSGANGIRGDADDKIFAMQGVFIP
jgi:hypothetical protein